MRHALAFVIALTVASTAAAQPGEMDCTRVGTGINCSESATSAARRARLQAIAASERRKAEAVTEKREALQRSVSQAVLEGRCDDARRIALEAGDLDAADKAMRLCTPAPPP